MVLDIDQLDPVKAAMYAELGSHRIDDLPCEDGHDGRYGRGPSKPPPFQQTRSAPVNSRWQQAISRGDFDDDDAAMVANVDTMEDGNLARQRRAGQLAFSITHKNYDQNALPRDRNGQVPPRASFHGQGKHRFMPVQVPSGDGPIDIDGTLSGRIQQPVPRLQNAQPPRGPAPPPQPGASRRIQPGNNLPSRPSGVPQASISQIAKAAAQFQPSDMQSQSPKAHQAGQETQLHPVIPDGASVVLRMAITVQSSAFVKRSQKYQGAVFLVSGRVPSENVIIFSVDDKDVADVKHQIAEFGDFMTASNQALLLQFTVSGFTVSGSSIEIFYAVDFGSNDRLESFVASLRKLVVESKENLRAEDPVQGPVDQQSDTVAVPEAASVAGEEETVGASKPLHNDISPVGELLDASTDIHAGPAVTSSLPSIDNSPGVIPAQPQTTTHATEPVQNDEASAVVPKTIIENIVSWVMDTVVYMRDCTQDFEIGMMRSIVRGTSAAIMMRQSPTFAGLSLEERTTIVELHCVPTVEKKFLERLASDQALLCRVSGDKPPVPSPPSQPIKQQTEVIVAVPSKPSPPVYSMEKLMDLRNAAADPPHWLAELAFLQEADRRRHNDPSKLRPGLQWQNTNAQASPKQSIEKQVKSVAKATAWVLEDSTTLPLIPMQTVSSTPKREATTARGISNNIVQSPKEVSGSSRQESEVQESTLRSGTLISKSHSPTLTVADSSGEQATANPLPSQDLASIYFDEPPSGLTSSIHNAGSTDIKSHGNFTGVFSSAAQKSTYFEDLMGLSDMDKDDEMSQVVDGFRNFSFH